MRNKNKTFTLPGNDAEQAALAKKLATIVLDAPVKFEEAEAEITKIDKQALKKVFEILNFKSLLERLAKKERVNVQNPPSHKATEDKKKKDEEQLGLL